jgi:hypothetical protein
MGICIAVDRYLTVEGNLQAIHHIIEARRTYARAALQGEPHD